VLFVHQWCHTSHLLLAESLITDAKADGIFMSIRTPDSAVQCSAVQCSGVQWSAVECSAVQCSAVQSQCSAVSVQCPKRHSNAIYPSLTRPSGRGFRTGFMWAPLAPALHCTTLHCTALHCTALHYHCTITLFPGSNHSIEAIPSNALCGTHWR
jgi:hypothetical protein